MSIFTYVFLFTCINRLYRLLFKERYQGFYKELDNFYYTYIGFFVIVSVGVIVLCIF